MATGDQADATRRVNALLPTGWFNAGQVPIKDALVAGLAYLTSVIYSLISYIGLQTRIRTATDGWLDLISFDYLGVNGLPRTANQSDASYRANILAAIFRRRNTRASIIKVLQDLTGQTPIIFEPWRPADTGGYGVASSMGYGVAGAYGSRVLDGQAFITAFRPAGSGLPNVAGYGTPAGGYGVGAIEYASLDMITESVIDADIYAAVNSVRPATRILWVRIENAISVLPDAQIDTESNAPLDTEIEIGLQVE